MREAIGDLLEKADLALAACAGVVAEHDLEPVIRSVRNVRTRLSYPEDVVVAALAGGTGSGKSSVLNAVAGWEAAQVGGARPTTHTPLALVPALHAGAIDGYLDRLGVTERVPFDHDRLCLIDLPDTDSVVVDHRLEVEALLPLLDVVVWVVDPEKYRDSELHHRYLRPLSAYSGQFLFVLNQVDRLDPDSVTAVVADLESALEEDGIEAAIVVPASADPPSGPPFGVDRLVGALEEVARAGAHDKLLVDLGEASARLADLAGGEGVDFEERAPRVVESAARSIIGGEAGLAVEELTGFLESVAGEAGVLSESHILKVAAEVPRHVQMAADEVEPERPSPKGWRRWLGLVPGRTTRPQRPSPEEMVASALNESVIRPVRAVLAKRAFANSALADLSLAVAGYRDNRRLPE